MSTDSAEQSDTINTEQEREALVQARKLLYKRFKVVVKDGRVLIGEFLCIDKQANLILGNTYQQVQGEKERPIGQVLVPALQRKSCHVEVMPHEQQQVSLLPQT